MTQLEKLTSISFHLIYHPPSNDEQLNTSIITTNARDWVMTLSRRPTKNFTLPINSNDTFRSTLTRKLNSIFTKTNTKSSSAVTTKLPGPSIQTFQSKIPRPSLNVDKPKSVRYRCTTLSSKWFFFCYYLSFHLISGIVMGRLCVFLIILIRVWFCI